MKNRVKVTIAALAIGVLAMCGNMTGYATESADAVSTQANEDGSTDAGGSNQNIYTVTYNLNGGTKDGKGTYVNNYNSESWKVDLSAIKPTRSGYRLTGWWYTDTNGKEQEIDTNKTINLGEVFPDIREATLTAEWTQVVEVTVDEIETETKVAAGNMISVKTASSNTLNLDKWVVNASDANNGWELKPNNNEGTIKVEPAAVENHVINVDGEKTGFGITKDNAKANFVSYWSPKNGYLVEVENQTGHPLKFADYDSIPDKGFKVLGTMERLPKKTEDGYFEVTDMNIKRFIRILYTKWNEKYVKCISVTLDSNRVDRNIKISFDTTQAEVDYSEPKVSECILKDSDKLTPQALLDTANVTAKRAGFTKYRWNYSVKDINRNSTKAESIPSNAWVDASSENILERTFNYSFPYYEFEFEPVWQGDVKFKLDIPTGESATTPGAIEGVDVGTTITLPEAPEIKGYTFNGWKSDVSANTVYEPGSSYKVTSANVTFTGSWTVNKYKITWKQGDIESELDPLNVAYKSQVDLPIPEKNRIYIYRLEVRCKRR